MKKKKSGGGGANWMDTYGDMVTLLLCFFVLLYSMSTISEENWRALVMSFNPNASRLETETVQGGSGPSADADESGVMPEPQDESSITQEDIEASIEALFQALSEYASQESMSSAISVAKDNGRVYVTFNETAFFYGNSSDLRDDALPILADVSEILGMASTAIDEVLVQGHTARADPNVPNDPGKDRKLSSERATNVVLYIQENSVLDPAKLISEGLGEWHPVADNNTAEGRAANRRVELIISGRDLETEMAGSIQNYSTVSTTQQTSNGDE